MMFSGWFLAHRIDKALMVFVVLLLSRVVFIKRLLTGMVFFDKMTLAGYES